MSALFYMTNQFRIKKLPELLTLTFDLNYTQKSKKKLTVASTHNYLQVCTEEENIG